MKLPPWRSWLPDSMFGRLFALVLAAMLASHLLTGLIVWRFYAPPHRPPMLQPLPPPDAGMPQPQPQPGFGPPPGALPPGGDPRHGGPNRPHRPPPELWLAQLLQLGAVLVAAWFGARQLAQPMARLAAAAGQLGANLSNPPLAESGPREAREAARGFNRMQQRIRQQLEERGRFLAAVSHDLRTPLTRMRLRVARFDESADRTRLQADIDEMAAMLDATLDYLRGAAQTEPWQLLDVQALLETLVEDAREAGHDVSLNGQAQPLLALPGALRRCIGNLLDNAFNYAGAAQVALLDEPEQLTIRIADNGPGIPENRINAVFEPFVRLEESRSRASGGVGLGLSIARELARQHGGELTLANRPAGGLLAQLVLPRRLHHA